MDRSATTGSNGNKRRFATPMTTGYDEIQAGSECGHSRYRFYIDMKFIQDMEQKLKTKRSVITWATSSVHSTPPPSTKAADVACADSEEYYYCGHGHPNSESTIPTAHRTRELSLTNIKLTRQ